MKAFFGSRCEISCLRITYKYASLKKLFSDVLRTRALTVNYSFRCNMPLKRDFNKLASRTKFVVIAFMCPDRVIEFVVQYNQFSVSAINSTIQMGL